MLSKEFKDAMYVAYRTRQIAKSNNDFKELYEDVTYEELHDYVINVIKNFEDLKTATDEEYISLFCKTFEADEWLYDYEAYDDFERGLIFGSIVGYDEKYAEFAETIWDYDGMRSESKFGYYSELCNFLEEYKLPDYRRQIVDMIDRM